MQPLSTAVTAVRSPRRRISFLPGRIASGFLLAISTFWGAGIPSPAADSPAIQVVACDAHVQSHKRGVAENKLGEADFRALAPGVSWFYNWNYTTDDQPPSDVHMEFLPMVWGDNQGSLDGVDSYLRDAPSKPRAILAINEPNLRGQAFIPPQETADLFGKVQEIGSRYGIPVVGPNMALGSAPGDSITAMDPVENKPVTYTFMGTFLKAFFLDLQNRPVAGIGLHSYGSIGELKWAVENMHQQFNVPIWVTEYANWSAPDVNAARDYLMQATDYLERTPYVAGYSWFKERSDNPKISLLTQDPGVLSPLGQAYVDMPVHDPSLYYRIPGRLQGASYFDLGDGDILIANNRILITAKSATTVAQYHIQVDRAGGYNLELCMLGPGRIDLAENNQVIGSVNADQNAVQFLSSVVKLPGGPQTLAVRFSAAGQVLSSINCTAAP
jgi:hypothetical protein